MFCNLLCNYRLVEIAASRFPAKFCRVAAQTDLCSQVHVFTELTCSSLLARCCSIALEYILTNINNSTASFVSAVMSIGLVE